MKGCREGDFYFREMYGTQFSCNVYRGRNGAVEFDERVHPSGEQTPGIGVVCAYVMIGEWDKGN